MRLLQRWRQFWDRSTPRHSHTAEASWDRDPVLTVDRWPEDEQMTLDDPTWTPPPRSLDDPERPLSTLG